MGHRYNPRRGASQHWRKAGDERWRKKVARQPSNLMMVLIGLGLGAAIGGGIIFYPRLSAVTVAGNGTSSRTFGSCHTGGGVNCVVDGDTFWMDGEKIRVADIDAPETHPPRCEYEEQLGNRATERLRDLLNAGPVELGSIDRDEDKYGRKLRIVYRNGQSIGEMMVSEGLVRPWTGARQPWC